MNRTVAAIFESPLQANEAVHVLLKARFAAERLPGIDRETARKAASIPGRLFDFVARRLQEFLGGDSALPPYAKALATGSFLVKVHVADDSELAAAQSILQVAGGHAIHVTVEEPQEAASNEQIANGLDYE